MQPTHLFIRTNYSYSRIALSDIRYFEANENYCRIYTKDGVHMLLTSLHDLEAILPPDQFCRIHRSYIVALEQITSFDKRTVFADGAQLPLGPQFRKNLLKSVIVLESSRGSRTVALAGYCL